MDITERMKQLLTFKDTKTKDLEELTGIDRNRWNNLRKTIPTAKARAEEVEALAKIYPEYAYWITTGLTIPDAGQISPELEESRQKLDKAG